MRVGERQLVVNTVQSRQTIRLYVHRAQSRNSFLRYRLIDWKHHSAPLRFSNRCVIITAESNLIAGMV